MNPSSRVSPETRSAIADAAAWRLLSLLLERPRPGWREEIEALAREVGEGDLQEVSAMVSEAREGVYLALLGPGGPVSPRECAYSPYQDPAAILADLKAFYEAFSYNPTSEEPLDHIATEAGFVSYLKMKEAYARARDDHDALGVTKSAYQRFLEEHLGKFAVAFHERLAPVAETYLFPAALALSNKISQTISSVEPSSL